MTQMTSLRGSSREAGHGVAAAQSEGATSTATSCGIITPIPSPREAVSMSTLSLMAMTSEARQGIAVVPSEAVPSEVAPRNTVSRDSMIQMVMTSEAGLGIAPVPSKARQGIAAIPTEGAPSEAASKELLYNSTMTSEAVPSEGVPRNSVSSDAMIQMASLRGLANGALLGLAAVSSNAAFSTKLPSEGAPSEVVSTSTMSPIASEAVQGIAAITSEGAPSQVVSSTMMTPMVSLRDLLSEAAPRELLYSNTMTQMASVKDSSGEAGQGVASVPSEVEPNDTASSNKMTRIAPPRDSSSEAASSTMMNQMTEHLVRLTRNLLELQRAGTGCDVVLQCQDGVISAHSGGFPPHKVAFFMSYCLKKKMIS